MARMTFDQYPTPVGVALDFFSILKNRGFLYRDMSSVTVLDPSCGSGNLLEAMFRAGVERRNLHGIEVDISVIDQYADRILVGDALKMDWPDADIIVMNPPYSHAMEFVQKAVDKMERGEAQQVIALLRPSFLGSQKRRDFHRAHESKVFVLSKRIKFVGNQTDNMDAAWFRWVKSDGIPSTIEVILWSRPK